MRSNSCQNVGVPSPSRSKVRSKSNFGLKVILVILVVLRGNPMCPTPFGHLGPHPWWFYGTTRPQAAFNTNPVCFGPPAVKPRAAASRIPAIPGHAASQGLRSSCVLALVLLYCFQRYILIQRDINSQEFFVPTDFGQFLPMSPPAPCPSEAPPSGRLFWKTDFFRCGPIMFWRMQRNAYGSYELAHTSYVQIGPLEKKLGSQTFSFFTP